MSKANVDDMMIAIQRAMIRGGDYGQAIRFIESQGYTMDEFLEAAGGAWQLREHDDEGRDLWPL